MYEDGFPNLDNSAYDDIYQEKKQINKESIQSEDGLRSRRGTVLGDARISNKKAEVIDLDEECDNILCGRSEFDL